VRNSTFPQGRTGRMFVLFASLAGLSGASAQVQSVTQNGATLVVPQAVLPGAQVGIAPGTGGSGGGTTPPTAPTVTPTALSFTFAVGTLPPVAQTLTINSAAPVFWNTTIATTVGPVDANMWLKVTPSTGTTVAEPNPSVSVTPLFLPIGAYSAIITVDTLNGAAHVAVTLTVTAQFTVAPSSLTFNYLIGGAAPATQTLTASSEPTPLPFTVRASTSNGGSWLSTTAVPGLATPNVITVSATPGTLAAGSYTGQILLTPVSGAAITVPVTLVVTSPLPPTLSVTDLTQTFSLEQNSTPIGGHVLVFNTGNGTLNYTATSVSDQGTWLQLAATNGTATAITPGFVAFKVNPAGLTPGIHSGKITIANAQSTGAQFVVNVMLTVSPASQSLQLSQTGLAFTMAVNGPPPQTQSFSIANLGLGSAGWTASAHTLTGNWLSATPLSGASFDAEAGTPITVTANSLGLAAGKYFGSVNVSAPDAVNSPQTVSVELDVTASAGISLSTGGMILTAPAGSPIPQTQQVTITNPGFAPATYVAPPSASPSWLTVTQPIGTLMPGTNTVTISGNFASLVGLNNGTVTFIFGDNTTQTLTVAALATGGAGTATIGSSAAREFRPAAAAACSGGVPGLLVEAIGQPVSQAKLRVATPHALRAQVIDGCGNPVIVQRGGSVRTTFSTENIPVTLNDIGGGYWEGTWTPATAATSSTVTVSANVGGTTITQNVLVSIEAAAADAPAQPGAVVNSASSAQATPQVLTPGAYFTLYGLGLAGTDSPYASATPFPTTLNGAQLFMGGIPLPLAYASASQVNALAPQALNANTSYQLVIQRGSTISTPFAITVASRQPGIFTADSSGSGQGAVQIAGSAVLAGPTGNNSRPAVRGTEYLSIYATGLGPVAGPNGEAAPGDGVAAPLTPLFNLKDTAKVTIGGVDAQVVYAGLAPTQVALYQVNALAPAGAAAGSAIPVTIMLTNPVDGTTIQSNTVTVALQ
jgi:uncharacterized protein (TIGR03437 family)